MTDRILVVGAGAIGGVTAAHLARAGHDVTTLDANVEHSALLVSPGLILEEPSGNTSTTPIRAVTDVSQLDGPFDFALITVKSLAIRAAITPLVDKDLVDTYVSLGNGLVQDVVESVVGPRPTDCRSGRVGRNEPGTGPPPTDNRSPHGRR